MPTFVTIRRPNFQLINTSHWSLKKNEKTITKKSNKSRQQLVN